MDSTLPFMKEGKVHNIELGSTFRKRKETAFHTVRYDFKPASVDLTQQGEVAVGETNDVGETNVTITLPHLQGSKSSSTVFKGSKKPAQKECLLIYDPATGSFTLERITSQIQVKKTRFAGNITVQPPVLPSGPPIKLQKKQTGKKMNNNKPMKPSSQEPRKPDTIVEDRSDQVSQPMKFPPANQPPEVTEPYSPEKSRDPTFAASVSGNLSSSGEDSSASDFSTTDDESSSNASTNSSPVQEADFSSQLDKDLHLSESSETDSDSD